MSIADGLLILAIFGAVSYLLYRFRGTKKGCGCSCSSGSACDKSKEAKECSDDLNK
ncbi:hypothetical protein MCHI_001602 [Candidatus Magnetoovum chiemensis]|nr:hypothetical protein MCHI_001602 [Candidatus Magnetoovum chiemensis]